MQQATKERLIELRPFVAQETGPSSPSPTRSRFSTTYIQRSIFTMTRVNEQPAPAKPPAKKVKMPAKGSREEAIS
ncbi:hypothetical protein TrVGV298_006302 [Trichoderma virens]|nr:hypothetical protein TrVGV298_006302 [Trichoderma virens]